MRHYYWTVLFLGITLLSGCSDTDREGDAFFKQGSYQEAVNAYTETIQEKGDDIDVRYNRGRSYQELGKLDLALQDFEWIIKKDPQHLKAILSLAQIAYFNQNYERALVLSQNALKIEEQSSQAQFMRARANHQLGYVQEALDAYNEVIFLDKDYADAYLYRGALKLALSKTGGCEDLQTAKNLDAAGAQAALDKYCG